MADGGMASHEYGLHLSDLSEFNNLDAVILAVNHREYIDRIEDIPKMVIDLGIVIDVKSAIDLRKIPAGLTYWSL